MIRTNFVPSREEKTPAGSSREMLMRWERVLAGVAGFVAVGFVCWLILYPPEHTEALADCTVTADEDCLVSVSTVPDAVTSVLVGAGAVLVLIALLGIRFRQVKGPGFALGADVSETTTQEAAEAKKQGKVEPVVVGAGEPEPSPLGQPASAGQLGLWTALPHSVREAALEWWNDRRDDLLDEETKTLQPWDLVEAVYKPTAGNNEWYVRFQNGKTCRAVELPAASAA